VVVRVLLVVVGVVLWRGLVSERPVASRAARPAAAHTGEGSHWGLSSLPLAAQGVVSGALGSDSRAYRVSRLGGGYQAVNPAQHLRARFDRAGVRVQSGGAGLGLRLAAVGYGASLATLGSVAPRARGNRVVYARAGLSEWYTNGPLGLEQGFTLARAPVGDAGRPLTLSLALSGDTRAAVDANGQSLTFAAPGSSSLGYDNLVATDAGGRTLYSWITLQGGRVLLHVDARGARYPLRIDPLIQQGSKLTGGKEETGAAGFGISVALSSEGNTALIGGPYENEDAGAVWVFTRSEGKWTQQGAKLTGGKEETGTAEFGFSVALSSEGNTALIGGVSDSSGVGAAWVFTRSEGKWTQQGAKLTGGKEEVPAGDFGYSVALSSNGNTALIGGPTDNDFFGAAWVFTRSEGKWTQQGAKITGKEEIENGEFGFSVALSSEGNTALIGGVSDSSGVGAAWVFTRSEGKWTQQAKLTSKGETEAGSFGVSVALSSEGNTALIGGADEDKNAGAASVFTLSEGKWTQQAKLTVKEEVGTGELGSSVALSSNGNTALLSGAGDNKNVGAVWVFTRSEGKWAQQGAKLTGKEETSEGAFGSAVALSSEGNTALIGGQSATESSGAAWVFATGPTATTGSATGITENEATLHGAVNPEGTQTKYYFEYGTTESYGSKTSETSAGSGTSSVEVSKAITGLKADTKYHYRIVATNSNVTADAADQAFSTTYWSLQEPPNPAGAKEGYLKGVSCASSSTECDAVGYFENSSEKFVPLAEKLSGTSWTAQEPPDPTGAKVGDLTGVSCASSKECTAVGYFENSSEKFVPLAEKLNGTSWTVQEPPNPTGAKEGVLWGVSCSASTACTAVGRFLSSEKWVPLAERWNGTAWSAQEPPDPTGAKESTLNGVSCTSSTDCTAAGYFENSSGRVAPLAEKWNGTSWSVQELPNPTGAKEVYLEGVSCASSSECVAVGEFFNSSEKYVPLAERWNGASWAVQEPPIPAEGEFNSLDGVSCTSSGECTAAGYFENSAEKDLSLAERWNGAAWSVQEPPNPTGAKINILKGVSCTSPIECTAAGGSENGSSPYAQLAERYR
jgi:hypothetical protein